MKKIISTILLTIILVGHLAIATPMTYAQDTETGENQVQSVMPTIPKPDILPGPSEGNTQAETISFIRDKATPEFIAGFIGIVGVAAFLSLLIAGIQFIMAFENEEQVNTAKRNVTYSLVGFVIAIMAYAIVSTIGSLDLGANMFFVKIAHAEDAVIEAKLGQLLPSEVELIEESPNYQGASLTEGNLRLHVLPKVIQSILYLISSLLTVALLYAGINLVIAQGNEEKVNKSKSMLVYIITGLVVIGLSFAIVYGLSQINF